MLDEELLNDILEINMNGDILDSFLEYAGNEKKNIEYRDTINQIKANCDYSAWKIKELIRILIIVTAKAKTAKNIKTITSLANFIGDTADDYINKRTKKRVEMNADDFDLKKFNKLNRSFAIRYADVLEKDKESLSKFISSHLSQLERSVTPWCKGNESCEKFVTALHSVYKADRLNGDKVMNAAFDIYDALIKEANGFNSYLNMVSQALDVQIRGTKSLSYVAVNKIIKTK